MNCSMMGRHPASRLDLKMAKERKDQRFNWKTVQFLQSFPAERAVFTGEHRRRPARERSSFGRRQGLFLDCSKMMHGIDSPETETVAPSVGRVKRGTAKCYQRWTVQHPFIVSGIEPGTSHSEHCTPSSCTSYTIELHFLHHRAALPTPSSCTSYTIELYFLHHRAALPTPSSCTSYTIELYFLHHRAALPTPSSCTSYTIELHFLHHRAVLPTPSSCTSYTIELYFLHHRAVLPTPSSCTSYTIELYSQRLAFSPFSIFLFYALGNYEPGAGGTHPHTPADAVGLAGFETRLGIADHTGNQPGQEDDTSKSKKDLEFCKDELESSILRNYPKSQIGKEEEYHGGMEAVEGSEEFCYLLREQREQVRSKLQDQWIDIYSQRVSDLTKLANHV
ncbi:hypothetical protein STEG23_026754 [Scotinomys teguina]